MRRLFGFLMILALASGLRADEPVAAAAVVTPGAASPPVSAFINDGTRKVSPGMAYGANTFAGMAVGAVLGAAVGAVPYALNRQNQDPSSVILGAVYGSIGGAVGLGLPLSAYEVASDKPGAGVTVLYNTLGFGVLGGVVGAGGAMISYRHKVDTDPQSGEDFLAAGAVGLCTGALVGFTVGLYEGVWYQGRGPKVPGKGIHASAGLMHLAAYHDDGQKVRPLTNATLLQVDF